MRPEDKLTSTNNIYSICLWAFAGLTHAISNWVTSISMDGVLTFLSILSVAMVIVINAKKFMKEIKGWF